MASESTQLQVNFKLADGTLVNIYADTAEKLALHLESIENLSDKIGSVSAKLAGKAGVAHLAQGLGGTVIQTTEAQKSPLEYSVDQCKHGPRTYRTSKPDAPKSWKGYFCPTPKGTPDQCEPNFTK